MFVKGAPDRLLPLCSSQLADDSLATITAAGGNTAPLNERMWLTAQEHLSSQGLRVLALCRCDAGRAATSVPAHAAAAAAAHVCGTVHACVQALTSHQPPTTTRAPCLCGVSAPPLRQHTRGEVGPDEDLSALNPTAILARRDKPFLTLITLLAILDPPRDEAIEAVKVAHRAGITVKMITGV
jgi:magnesium-transporting ATPase (P-type)